MACLTLLSNPAYNPRRPELLARPESWAFAPGVFVSKGRISMNNKPAYLSKEGLEKLREELDEMVNVRRAEVAARIHEAKEHGDITENAEYEDAKNEQAFVEGRIQALSALIKNAVVIAENHSTTHVQIGSTVTLHSQDGKESFTIVGSAEAAPAQGRISNESPVGRALLGHKKGEEVVVSVPAGDTKYKITNIS
jgi:transcription elongation factor GreA